MTYADEVRDVPVVLRHAEAGTSAEALDRVRGAVLDGDLIAVGSGGTLAVAELLAYAHVSVSGHLASAVTSLEFLERKTIDPRSSVVIFSARAKHPDTANVVRHAQGLQVPVILITGMEQSSLPAEIVDGTYEILTVPFASEDGFLATRSLISMACAVGLLYGAALPDSTPPAPVRTLRQRLLVLYSAATKSVAIDIETRMHELGLADVQLADYRNLAHGRHVGLDRRQDSTTVVSLIVPAIRQLAERTLAALPSSADLLLLESKADGVTGAIELLTQSVDLPTYAEVPRGDPAKPRVSAFGRRLYHLQYRRSVLRGALDPIDRKLAAAGFAPDTASARDFYAAAHAKWRAAVRRLPISGVMIDWDGTAVKTSRRWDGPANDVVEALVGVCDLGLELIVATGRGDSLYSDLRVALPRRVWQAVTLELHNGTWTQPLAAELTSRDEEDPTWSTTTSQCLEPLVLSGIVHLRTSSKQVSVRPVSNSMSAEGLAGLVRAVTDHLDGVTVTASGHSVDIVPSDSGKSHALRRAEQRLGNVLAIGDQGQPGGNDHALLRSGPLSITVSRCSADPDSCWPVARTTSGPAALVAALQLLKKTNRGVYFRV